MLILILLCICFVKEISDARIKREKVFEPHLFSSCFEDIGCIDFNEKWFNEKYRPKNKEPLDRHTIRTEFLMMKNPANDTNHLVYDVMSFRKETIEVAGFKKGTCSIFIIHDFTSNGYTGWIKHMVVAFSKRTDCNIISIDWEAGAEPPFDQAISNARVVALESKNFINVLKGCFGQSPANLHLVGHGVGAHIAGYIGKYIPGLQRITGLDPTGPFFEKMPKEVRLDADDARYVEIIHTDSFNHRSQGGRANYGHADFYINNADHQPGCNDSSEYPSFQDIKRDNIQEGKILPACSHKRSFKYYIESLEDNNCQFIAVKCPNIEDFKLGKCNDCTNKPGKCGKCATFGLVSPSVNTLNNTYYLQTNGKKPFCLLSYSVNITIEKGEVGREVEGYFEFILVDDQNRVTNASNDIAGKNIRKFNSGIKYPFIFYAPPPAVGHIKEAKVKWIYKSKKICIMCDKSISVKEIELKRMSMKSANNVVSRICPTKVGAVLKDQDYVQFENCLHLYGPDYVKNGHKQLKEMQMNKTAAAMKATTKAPPICEIEPALPHPGRGVDARKNQVYSSGSYIPTEAGDKRDTSDKDEERDIKGFKDCFDDSAMKKESEGSIVITRFGKRKRKSRKSRKSRSVNGFELSSNKQDRQVIEIEHIIATTLKPSSKKEIAIVTLAISDKLNFERNSDSVTQRYNKRNNNERQKRKHKEKCKEKENEKSKHKEKCKENEKKKGSEKKTESQKEKNLKEFKDCYDESMETTTTEKCCMDKKSTAELNKGDISIKLVPVVERDNRLNAKEKEKALKGFKDCFDESMYTTTTEKCLNKKSIEELIKNDHLIDVVPVVERDNRLDSKENEKALKGFKDCFDESMYTTTTEKCLNKKAIQEVTNNPFSFNNNQLIQIDSRENFGTTATDKYLEKKSILFIKITRAIKQKVTPRAAVLGKQGLVAYPLAKTRTETEEPHTTFESRITYQPDSELIGTFFGYRDEGFHLPESKTDDPSLIITENEDSVELNNNDSELDQLSHKREDFNEFSKNIFNEMSVAITTEGRNDKHAAKLVNRRKIKLLRKKKRKVKHKRKHSKKTKKNVDNLDDIENSSELADTTLRHTSSIPEEEFLSPGVVTDDPSIVGTEKLNVYKDTEKEEKEEANIDVRKRSNLEEEENLPKDSKLSSSYKKQLKHSKNKKRKSKKRKNKSHDFLTNKVKPENKNKKNKKHIPKLKITIQHKRKLNRRDLNSSEQMEEIGDTLRFSLLQKDYPDTSDSLRNKKNENEINIPGKLLQRDLDDKYKEGCFDERNLEIINHLLNVTSDQKRSAVYSSSPQQLEDASSDGLLGLANIYNQQMAFSKTQRRELIDRDEKEYEQDLKDFKICFDPNLVTTTTVGCWDDKNAVYLKRNSKNLKTSELRNIGHSTISKVDDVDDSWNIPGNLPELESEIFGLPVDEDEASLTKKTTLNTNSCAYICDKLRKNNFTSFDFDKNKKTHRQSNSPKTADSADSQYYNNIMKTGEVLENTMPNLQSNSGSPINANSDGFIAAGSYSELDEKSNILGLNDDEEEIPKKIQNMDEDDTEVELYRNYLNPFKSTTQRSIEYQKRSFHKKRKSKRKRKQKTQIHAAKVKKNLAKVNKDHT